jgi:chromosome segregation ATPase
MIPGLGGGRGFGAAATPTRPSVNERVSRAIEALKVEKDDERAALRELIEKIVKAQDAVEDYQKSSRDRAGEAARNAELSEQALEDRLGEVRKERRRLEKAVADLQAQLADVVSARQEAVLVQQGIL